MSQTRQILNVDIFIKNGLEKDKHYVQKEQTLLAV